MQDDSVKKPMGDTDRVTKEKTVNIPKTILISIVTGIVTGSLSYAVAQAKMCGEVREDNIQMKAQMAAQKDDIKDDREHMAEIASRLDKLLGQNTELITLIRVQNQLKQQ